MRCWCAVKRYLIHEYMNVNRRYFFHGDCKYIKPYTEIVRVVLLELDRLFSQDVSFKIVRYVVQLIIIIN